MTGPKHLWSGDWESESAQTADELASAPRPVFDPEPEPEPESRATLARRWSRRQIAIALTTGIAAAAIAVAAVTVFNGSGGSHKPKAHKPAASAPASRSRTPGPTGGTSPITACQQIQSGCGKPPAGVHDPTADWLGMQIVSSPAGVVINTVALGSIADQAGFEPGDQIEQISGHHVDNLDQVRQATAGIAIGKPVSIEVLRSSVMLQAASIAMTQRPTIHP